MYDILASTSNPIMINSVYGDELPVTYESPKPEKKQFIEEDLYNSDLFSFGSIIGSITNKGSNGYALLPIIEKEYGKESDEYKILISRLQQCCKAQAKQIDKTKIGKAVKGIPKVWVTKTEDEKLNRTLLNKYPYFFTYRYKDARDKYRKYVDENNMMSHTLFGMSVDELMEKEAPDEKQSVFISNYYKYIPVTISDSSMNLICKYVEKVDFDINRKIKSQGEFDWSIYKNKNANYTDSEYKVVIKLLKDRLQKFKHEIRTTPDDQSCKFDSGEWFYYLLGLEDLEDDFLEICSDVNAVTNILVDYYYRDKPTANKELLWRLVGKYMIENLYGQTDNSIYFPVANENGDIKYLGNTYKLEKILIDRQ